MSSSHIHANIISEEGADSETSVDSVERLLQVQQARAMYGGVERVMRSGLISPSGNPVFFDTI